MSNSKIITRENISIINENFLESKLIHNSSVDLIITSPPYNVGLDYSSYNDSLPYIEYLEFSREWITKCYELVKDDGRMCLNIPIDKNKGGKECVGADIIEIAKKVGWKYNTTIVWNEGNISNRKARGSWISAYSPCVIAPVELIVVFYKKKWQKESGSKKSDISKYEFVEWTKGMWDFSGERRFKNIHPAAYPIDLPYRCIKLFSYIGDLILDPFMGTGTTLLAAKQTGREAVGVELDRNYCNFAFKRLFENKLKINEEDTKYSIAI